MAQRWGSWYLHLGIASLLAIGGALALGGGLSPIACFGDGALAQIKPDGTLGASGSVVTPTNINGIATERIDGGVVRGANLFHSFEQFSVPTGGAAYFNNPLNIQNVISRVTGGSISHIDGLIRANATANLFLLNPNGIIFGPNATLSIGGSFVGSTASSLNFADGTQFSATANPTTPLLTISVPIGLQFGVTAGHIRNESKATNSGLRVESGKTLALVGGEVHLDGGSLQALDGRVELGGLAGSGTVELNVDSNDLRLKFPTGVARADVFLNNNDTLADAAVNVRGANGGGSIAITARNLDIDRVKLRAGIAPRGGSVNSFSGDIEINATGFVKLTNYSFISNSVEGDYGTGGNINITTQSLSLTSGAAVSTGTNGKGNAGSVNITARDRVSFDGMGSGAFSNVNNGATGNSGGINITTGALSVTNGATLYANTSKRGNGNPGSVNIRAGNTVSFDGSSAFSSVERGASGNSGGIYITTGELTMKNGAQLNASNSGKGNAGSVNIDARSMVSFDGVGSKALSNVGAEVVGNSGNINIKAESLFMLKGAALDANNRGTGNAGSVNITARDRVSFDGKDSGAFSQVTDKNAMGNSGDINITTSSLAVRNGAQLSVGTFGRGKAGSVNIHARSKVSFDGGYAYSSVVNKEADGNSGGININAESLAVTNGALLDTDTNGKGNAGSVNIDARSTVSFDGVGFSNGYSSGIFSRVNDDAIGNGGDISIKAESLSVTNGAQLNASTRGQGDGGNITLEAKTLEAVNGGQVLTTSRRSGKAGNITLNVRDITVSGSDRNYDARSALGEDVVSGAGPESGLFANTALNSTAQGGNLTITTGHFYVRDGAQVNVSSEGSGDAGNLKIASGNLLLDNRGTLRAASVSGKGGNIDLQIRDLILILRNSLISAQADNNGNGGNITINSPLVVALPSEDSDIVANAVRGRGGKINITAQGIYGLEYHPQLTPLSDINASSVFGVNGIVQINTLGIERSLGLVKLPAELVEASRLIATGCAASGENKFIITGRGGLPPNPYEPLDSSEVWRDVQLPRELAESDGVGRTSISPTMTPRRIVEAQGWIVNENGNVELVAKVPTAISQVRCGLRSSTK